MSLGKKTLSGLSWTMISTIINVVLQVTYTSWISKILTPATFGLMAIAMMVLGFGSHFAKTGIGQAVIQKKILTKEDIRAAFTLSMVFSFILFFIVYLSSPLVAQYFSSDLLSPILRLMAFGLLISGFSIVSGNLLRREMQFKQISLLNILSYVISYPILGITLALNNWGVWSLVYAALFQTILYALAQYILSPHTLLPTFQFNHFRPILSYGSKISLNGILTYIMNNLENIFIARYVGKTALGYYNRAHLLVYLPAYYMHQSLSSVLFPAFSKLQNQIGQLKEIYCDVVSLSSALLIPTCLSIAVAAPECVYMLLGYQWTPSIPILQFLCFIIPFNLLASYAGIICDAVDALRSKIIFNIAILVFMLISFYLVRYEGIYGFLMILLLRDILKTIFFTIILTKIFSSSIFDTLKAYLPGIYHGIITACTVLITSYFVRFFLLPLPLQLTLQILTGLLCLMIQFIFIPHFYLKRPLYKILSKLNLKKFEKNRFYPRFQEYLHRMEISVLKKQN